MDARALAIALNGEVAGRDRVLVPGPGHSPRDRSLSVRLDPAAPEGFVCYSFSSDDWRECREHVRRAMGVTRLEPVACSPAPRRPQTTTADALALWQQATDAHGTVIESYLRSRQLELPPGDATIRHCPQIGPHGEPDAVMVALMRHVESDRPIAVHRTYVDHTGSKTGRRMLGPAKGAAIQLAPATGSTLVVAEGIETALAASAAGMTPVWAMGSAGAISALVILPRVAKLVILAEIDGGANREAVAACRQRWCGTANKTVFVVTPTVGEDFADVWVHAGARWHDHVAIERFQS
ncbi:MAG: toprim domain-containing protein [Beijerinckiaceae bacterium]